MFGLYPHSSIALVKAARTILWSVVPLQEVAHPTDMIRHPICHRARDLFPNPQRAQPCLRPFILPVPDVPIGT